ncbi:HD domain-containing protein [Rhodohalobacter sp.]|uniref:Ppx/GppA phosphatase family protein n=1 Tax=Rhodohalobacter sp. TaxID=1974210 RepID=UPI00356AF0EF
MNQSFPRRPVKRIAAIDLGTNSFHALIVEIFSDGSFYTVDKLKEMVLLAEKGLGNRLSDQAMERGIDALKKIKLLADNQQAETILAYATSAIREAENGGDFIQCVIDEVGVKINAIPGRIEAELIGLAVQHGIRMPKTPAVIMDIGGGSVEFILADQEKFHHLSSKKLGVARMTARFVDHDPITQEEIDSLKKHFDKQLADVAEAFAMHRSSMLIGSSGTMENIGLMIAHRNNKTPNLTVNELEFTDKEFFEFYDDVIGLNGKKRAKLKGLDEKRIKLLPAGLVLVYYILKKFGIKRVKISSQALREGIVLRFIKKEMSEGVRMHLDETPRRRSVLELVHKCDWHKDHSIHVAEIALKLFDELSDELNLEFEDRELLEYASFMHDIGYHISHRKHHKHALYIINNADLKGFKEEEIDVMANVARYHRRSTPKSRHSHYKKLDKNVKNRVEKLSAILRVADGLDRSHFQNVRDLEVVKSNGQIKLNIETETDPNLEIWGAMRKRFLFEEVTGKELKIIHSEKAE